MLARSIVRFAALSAYLVPAALLAQGEIIPRPCLPPGACGPIVPQVVRVRSDVRAELADRVLRYEITEVFVNRGGRLGEADYLFPLPTGAAFEDLRLSINGELVAGQTLGADEARRVYEEIVRRQRDPALVEWMGHGLLRARIFPIQPGERKTVVVRYQTVAEREGDALRVDYRRGTARPAPRPVPMREDAADDDASGFERSRSRFLLAYRPDEGLGAPYSPSNALSVTDSAGRRWVRVRDDAGDVTLLLPVRRSDAASISMLANAPGDEDGFALVTLSPPARRAAPTPRDVTFVLDVSGSMKGTKIAQAREAGRRLLETLTPRDRFRLIDFSDDVHVYHDGYVTATPAHVAAARRYLGGLEAEGSTNIAGALRAALAADAVSASDDDDEMPDERLIERPIRDGSRLPLVLFVTDGEPTVGERDPDAIAALAARLRGRARVFTFGLGADVNAALVERLAVEGRGTAQFVRPQESVERAVALVASRLAVPVVTDLTVRADGVSLVKTLPAGSLDLFAGQDLVVLTRYTGSGPARLVFSGRSAEGPVRWTQTVRFPSREYRNPFVARLWATQRVGWLSAERHKRGASPELDDEIRTLGLRYGIPTELTSYFVREPGMDAITQNGPVRDFAVPPRLDGRQSAPSAAPMGASAPARREAAFDAAKTAAVQRQAVSLAAADSASVAMADESGARTQRVGTRLFALRGEVWTDTRLTDGERRVRVRPFSDAWFALVQRLPELRDPFALGERVIVAGRKVAIELAPDGAATLSAAELDAVARDW